MRARTEPGCLGNDRIGRAIRTASLTQVRQPVFRRSEIGVALAKSLVRKHLSEESGDLFW
jgi:hypothetical protein